MPFARFDFALEERLFRGDPGNPFPDPVLFMWPSRGRPLFGPDLSGKSASPDLADSLSNWVSQPVHR
jgi:hypothetical protein